MKTYEYQSEHDEVIYKIRVGDTAQENWDLINDSKQNDLWFHVENYPSCHVVLTVINSKYPHKSVINYCSALCKEGSKLNNNKNITIIYTEIKNVKKAEKIGSVITKNTKNVKI